MASSCNTVSGVGLHYRVRGGQLPLPEAALLAVPPGRDDSMSSPWDTGMASPNLPRPSPRDTLSLEEYAGLDSPSWAHWSVWMGGRICTLIEQEYHTRGQTQTTHTLSATHRCKWTHRHVCMYTHTRSHTHTHTHTYLSTHYTAKQYV